MSMQCDNSIHIKIYRPEYKPTSMEFEYSFSVMEFLRDQWLTIPHYELDGTRGMVTDLYPSLSMALSGYCPRSFVKWLPEKLGQHEVLVVGWGSSVFLIATHLVDESYTTLVSLSIPSSGRNRDPIDSLHVSGLRNTSETSWKFTVTATTVRLSKISWNLCVISDAKEFISVTSATPEYDDEKSAASPRVDGECLSGFVGMKFSYVAKRGVRSSIEVFRNDNI